MTQRKPRRAADAVVKPKPGRGSPPPVRQTPAARPTAQPRDPTASTSTSTARGTGRAAPRGPVLALGLVAGGLVLAAVVWWAMQGGAPAAPADRAIGGVYGCRAMPAFVQAQGFGGQAALSTSEQRYTGLVLIEGAGTENPRVYQHPSWSSAGHLAPIQLDRRGNVFVVPAPQINVLENPAAEQNAVYRVDGASGEMARYVELPAAAPPSDQNPFGALGLAYDCDTDSLYASSVAGSTRRDEVGRIFRVDAQSPKVLTQRDGVDAMGVGVFNGRDGKRLYYGLARAPEIWSIALDAAGDFTGEPRLELSLEGLGPRGDDKARRIRFDGTELTVHAIEFNFNLVAPTEKQETLYRFGYDAADDRWVPLEGEE